MYIPDESILKKYADVLIKFALWSGNGVRTGEVVYLRLPESAKPFLVPLQRSILEAGAYPLIDYIPEDTAKDFYDYASQDQILWQPKELLLERVKTADHFVSIISTDNKFELKGVDTKKIMDTQRSLKFYMDARFEKENKGNLTWTLGLYGTQAMAKEASLSVKEYWDQIIDACFLDYKDPITQWKTIFNDISLTQKKLNTLAIDWVHVEGVSTDLHVQIGANRKWLGGSGRNIPSFELFTTPDWRGTTGRISFDQPLYRYGNLIKGICLEFKEGVIVNATAEENESLLQEMIAVEGANKIGEFSLTDKRFSRITKFMAETLYDENIGGPYGNTHVAVGMGYKDCYSGDPSTLTKAEWEKMGFNDSAVHTDIISTEDRIVTAKLQDGTTMILYKDGMFNL